MARKTNNADQASRDIFTLAEGETPKTPYLWDSMPAYHQPEGEPYHTLEVFIRTPEDMKKFAKLVEQENITEKTKAIRYPGKDRFRNSSLRWFGPAYPSSNPDKTTPVKVT